MTQRNRDGVVLVYEEAGSGAPPIVLVHPWGGDHAYMAPQFDYFRRDHRVVSVGLRGHGRSDKPEQDYTMGLFAEDLVWLCRELRIEKPVVVGHSMGGMIALELAARVPELPSAVVLLDSPVVTPPGLMDGFRPFAEALPGPGYREATRQFYSYVAGFDDRTDRKQRIIEEMASNVQHVMVSTMQAVLAHDTDAAAAACKVPVLYVSSGTWYTDVARFHKLCPHLITGQTVGSGHFHQLEVPEQVNPMIERFLTIAVKAVG